MRFITITAELNEAIASLLHRFNECGSAHQHVAQALAVIYKPIELHALGRILAHSELRALEEITDKALKHIITDLCTLELVQQSRHGYIINRLIANALVKRCIGKNLFVTLLSAAEQVAPVLNSYQWQDNTTDKHRLLRDMYFLGEQGRVKELMELTKNPMQLDWQRTPALCSLVFYPFNLDEFKTLDERLQYQAFATLLAAHRQKGQSTAQLLHWLHQACDALPKNRWLHYLKAEQYLLAGQLDKLNAHLDEQDNSLYSLLLRASLAFLQQQYAKAMRLFTQAELEKGRYQKRKKPYIEGLYGLFYQLTLLALGNGQQGDTSSWQTLQTQLDNQQQDKQRGEFALTIDLVLRRLLLHLRGRDNYLFRQEYLSYCQKGELNYYLYVCFALAAYTWSMRTPEPWLLALKAEAERFFEHIQWPLFTYFLLQISGDSPNFTFNITQLMRSQESWDIALEQLLALDTPAAQNSEEPSRVVWQLDIGRFESSLKAKEQKRTKQGWSKGKALSLKHLVNEPERFHLSEQDKAICAHIETSTGKDYYRSKEYRLNLSSALPIVVGADNLVDGEGRPLELVQREPTIRIVAHGPDLSVSIAHLPALTAHSEPPVVSLKHVRDGLAEFSIFNANHLKVAKIIGESGLVIPAHAKQKAIDSIRAIAPLINLESDIEGIGETLTQTEPDKHLVVNITPLKTGLNFDCVVMPFGEHGPTMKPGLGSRHVSAHIKGKRIALERDLAYEQRLLEQLDNQCPDFQAMQDTCLAQTDWQLALATLEQLQLALSKPNVELPIKLRWPRGKTLHMTKPLKSENIQLSINQHNEWFDISGSATLDDGKILELRQLLDALATSGGRFITLEDNRILALSEQLKTQLDVLNGAADQGFYHPLSSRLIRDHTTGMRMQTVPGWEQLHQRMSEANALTLTLPNTLQAQLRDYQVDGFDWAMRLAHWGAGGCLADDMGLGKTLQALAVLVARAAKGPTLIIAPTSVCFNWQKEAAKFAPTLRVQLFSELKTAEAQQAAIEQSAAFDCLVISYQQMQRHIETLEKIRWCTIVADEAQALKNPLAKRTRAAYALKGDFRLITTGTPIENNITELWSLFRFINPGLLGNLKRFGRRFVLPIDNQQQEPAKALKAKRILKELIKPFILRRLKSEVLTELPERTDIDQLITLSEDEQHLYEALRQNALEQLTQLQQLDNPGEQRIQLLAQLTKLRQACCHPQLVAEQSTLTSSKLSALGHLLEELRDNHHKALIFSQFVGHLQLIREYLEEQGIGYQYLDGSTPAAARQTRIDAFQNGAGEVFLISLKAGGSGLNLTAADYVIHMDPWWNPAVEQQASDRAHRLGQTRPVTVYRLIAKGTIEEKILALHQHKRDLADSLLSDYDTPQSLSVEEMMATLKEVF
ncbi:DEAD/DEAH box helicase [Pseudoalteromonas sp. T1lg10]|uniref:DEAD/DEAH box helicase n=1 Tax=Pseudoalteromonas sp. T1lg10 TaxID=2077093 RepID=UPI000CF60476|nr:DEAD/DEAH box helicase [Pseudoalteromonas sp. T1lg10]